MTLALGLALAASAVQAAQLRDHRGVNNGLIIAGIVETIYETCPTLDVRKLRGFMYLRSLYSMAKSAGFSHDEIEAYVENDEEEARLRVRVDAWLERNGAKPGDAESYCAIGRDHMDRGTQIGVLLKAD